MRGAVGAVAAVAGKEVRDILRERTIVVAVLVQFFIAAFSTFLTVGLLALYDPGSAAARPQADIAYVGEGGFDDVLDGARNIDLRRGLASPLADFAAGDLDAVVEERVSADGVHTVTIVVPEGEMRSTLLVTQLRDLLQAHESNLRQANQARVTHDLVQLPAEPPRAPVPYGFVYATLVPLLLLTPVFLAGALAGDTFTAEIEQRTLLILRSAPLSLRSILLGKLAVPALLAPAQFLLWAGLLALNRQVVHNLALLCLLATALTVLLSGVGYALAATLRREGPVQATYALAAIMLAVGSLLLPRDLLNTIARLAAGDLDATALMTVGALVLAGLACALGGAMHAARRIRRDLL